MNYIQGDTKRCMGYYHKGEYVSLKYFYFFKSGPKKGKPFARCRLCTYYKRYGNTEHGLILYDRVKFIFDELTNRLGKAETLRRIGVSRNFFIRRGENKSIRAATVVRAMKVLQECRENDVRRHKRSIRHGATARGREEREIKGLGHHSDFYNSHFDIHNENRKVKYKDNAKEENEKRAERYRRKRSKLTG